MADILVGRRDGDGVRRNLPEPPVGGFVLSIYKRISDRKAQGQHADMDVSLRIDCTPTEARRLIGAPDLLPLYEITAVTLEDCLVCLLARLDPHALAPQRPEPDQSADGGRSGAA
jgi:hypothetical protein